MFWARGISLGPSGNYRFMDAVRIKLLQRKVTPHSPQDLPHNLARFSEWLAS